MSKERARRRAAREAEIAARAAQRERREAALARRRSWQGRLFGWVPDLPTPAPGLLAAKRRRKVGLIVLGFLVVQALTWAWTPDWGTRVGVLVASIFAFPLIAVLA